MKSGMVFQSGKETPVVQVAKIRFILKSSAKVLSFFGSILILAALIFVMFIYLPLGLAQGKYFVVSRTVKIREYLANLKAKEPEIRVEADKPTWMVPDQNYSLYVPKIEAVSRVIKDVNAAKPKEYMAALKLGVAETAGLAHPGEVGTTYLFAHSVGNRIDFARYNAVFYLLDKLDLGDGVEIVYEGRFLKYRVVGKEVIPANDIKYLIPQTEEEKLILQTCYPPGSTWKRLIVVAKRVS